MNGKIYKEIAYIISWMAKYENIFGFPFWKEFFKEFNHKPDFLIPFIPFLHTQITFKEKNRNENKEFVSFIHPCSDKLQIVPLWMVDVT